SNSYGWLKNTAQSFPRRPMRTADGDLTDTDKIAGFTVYREHLHETGRIIGDGEARQERAAQIRPWRPFAISRPAPAMAKFAVAIESKKFQLPVRALSNVRPGQPGIISPMHIDRHQQQQ